MTGPGEHEQAELIGSIGRPNQVSAVEIQRRVEWVDTDAAGHHHHHAIARWVEAAEAELLRRYGVDWLFGRTPRVHYEVDYRQRLWFGDLVRVRIQLDRLGERSMHLGFAVRGEKGIAAAGKVVTAFASSTGAAEPWPIDVRRALSAADTLRDGARPNESGTQVAPRGT